MKNKKTACFALNLHAQLGANVNWYVNFAGNWFWHFAHLRNGMRLKMIRLWNWDTQILRRMRRMCVSVWIHFQMAPTQFMSTIGWYFVCDSNDDGSIYNFMFFAWILLSLEVLYIHFILLLCLTSQNIPPNTNSLQWICWHQWINELRFCWSVHRFTLNNFFVPLNSSDQIYVYARSK